MILRAAPLAMACIAVLLPLAGCGRGGARVDTESGLLRSRGQLTAGGAPTGEWTFWYSNGEVRERGPYVEGRREGTWTRWYPNGQRHSEGERRWDAERGAALREGPWRAWFSNGQLRSEGSYRQGRREGQWTCWNHRGLVDDEQTGTYAEGALLLD